MYKLFISCLLVVLFTGCVKNDPVLIQDTKVEFDATTWNANAVGVTYPILLRQPINGAGGGTGNAILRTTTKVTLRVNLVGAQRSEPTVVKYRAFDVGTASSSSITYTIAPLGTTAAPRVIPVADAISGVHYAPLSGTTTIPANSSFGTIDIIIIDGGTDVNEVRILGLEILPEAGYQPNVNYAKVAIAISQRII